MSIDLDSLQDTLDEWAYDEVTPALLQHRLQILNQRGLDRLPLPGQGQTLDRWRALAQVAIMTWAWSSCTKATPMPWPS